MVAIGFPARPVTQQHQQLNNLPNTRPEESAKLKFFQLSTLPRRHSSLVKPFAKMETLKRTVRAQVSLADTCPACVPLSSVLVVNMNWIAARMSYQLATLARI